MRKDCLGLFGTVGLSSRSSAQQWSVFRKGPLGLCASHGTGPSPLSSQLLHLQVQLLRPDGELSKIMGGEDVPRACSTCPAFLPLTLLKAEKKKRDEHSKIY